ncbi:MAG: hydroxymethylglutaryl-CoA reductase, degradative [Streptococcus orisratti]|uniref:hydroxymethylglutaryl-CoA reductase, degradative n=1 Tax=Streptococcus orisratti TaxID=114652 RepID=UPI0023568E0D|nr:hydroxymethylglutaryl-CoA reductase, degradative [Streptococcus orisratti]MCI7677423.1 hydroxymethylglutaryl-CoA reductase, degradative [Streptococcus orisratti]
MVEKMTKLSWTGFAKKAPQERVEHLRKNNLLNAENQLQLEQQRRLSLETANQMAENVIGTHSLPLALVPDVLVDGKEYQVPFVTEEPSVVAAASFAAKIIKRSGGFQTIVHNREMIGQVALYNVPDSKIAEQNIFNQTALLLSQANDAHPSIVKRGGGARELRVEVKEEFLIVFVTIDTQEAMGANMVNTMMEAITPTLEELSGGQALMAILSNYATESLVTATCSIDLRFLSRDKKEAQVIAQKMELASYLAQVDIYRASTHNKGIFNGIDAVVMATGNDWRAIEAGCHAYACQNGQYRGLSNWTFDKTEQVLKGQLTLPMPIATKGGSIGLNPTVQISHDLLNNPCARDLASVIVSVGLAQNFAALKALTTTGIQAGHMKLQAKSLALLAGASQEELNTLVTQLLQAKHLNQETAQAILQKIRDNKN